MFGSNTTADNNRTAHGTDAAQVHGYTENRILQIGVCGFSEYCLPADTDDESQGREEEDIGTGRLCEAASKVEGQNGYENIEEAAQGKDPVCSLKQLNYAKNSSEIEGVIEGDAFGEGQAHLFSLPTNGLVEPSKISYMSRKLPRLAASIAPNNSRFNDKWVSRDRQKN